MCFALFIISSSPLITSRCSSCHVPRLCTTIEDSSERSFFPCDRQSGHDPSLGAPLAGHHRVWPSLENQCASPSCHRIANTKTASSHHCHLTLCKIIHSCTARTVKQCLCLQVAIVRRQRVGRTMTCRPRYREHSPRP